MGDDLGHPGSRWFHLKFLPTAYGGVMLPLMVIGLIYVLKFNSVNRKLSIAFLAMVAVIFLFFSLFVATKMPAFVYPVSSVLLILTATGIYYLCTLGFDYLHIMDQHRLQILAIITLCLGFLALKPGNIAHQRSVENTWRNNKIHNAEIFRHLDDSTIQGRVILNCRPYENIEFMFYKDVLAYHWYPEPRILDSLQSVGYKFAAFEYKNDPQQLPAYITGDSTILILDKGLK
jgi:hypothetical protein